MKGAADIGLLSAASATVGTLRDVLNQLSAADAVSALQTIHRVRPALHFATDKLRLAVKGRGDRKQRINQKAVNLWDVVGPAANQARTLAKGVLKCPASVKE